MLLETGIGLGLKGISSLLGYKSDKKQRDMYQAQMRQSQGQFDAQMDESVQRRVADAKAAGIHPLFAMGASVGASPTISAGSPPRGGKAQQGLESLAESLGVIGINRSEAARNEAEATLMQQEAAQIRQDMMSQGRDIPAQADIGERPLPAIAEDPEYFAPEREQVKERGVRHPLPMFVEVTHPDGRTSRVPNPDLNLDDISNPGTLTIYKDKIKFWLTDQMLANDEFARVLQQDREIKKLQKELQKQRFDRQGKPTYGMLWPLKALIKRVNELRKSK